MDKQADLAQDLMNKLQNGEMSIEELNQRLHELVPTNKRIYVPPTIKDIRQKFATNRELRRRAIESNVYFITPEIGEDFRLSQGLILICGVSGQGKSTTLANLVAGYLDQIDEKKVLVITNEENTASVYDRIACCMLGVDFKRFYQNKVPKQVKIKIDQAIDLITERVVVEEGSVLYDMTCLEDTQAALVHAASGDYGFAAIDYFQTVTWSRENEKLEPVQVSKKLGFFLKDYGRKVEIPIAAFAQLKPKSDSPDMPSRIQNDRTIYNHAFMVIEVIPNFDTQSTKFVFHKDRFGLAQSKEIEMKYQGGKFVPVGL